MARRDGLLKRLADWANTSDQHAKDLREAHGSSDSTTVAASAERQRVTLRGTLRSVSLRPQDTVSALEAELDDGTGVMSLLWLGRRRIVGIEPGRAVIVSGRVGVLDGRRVIYNPRYELLP